MAENKNAKTPADGSMAWSCQCGRAYTVTCLSSKPAKKEWVGLTDEEVYECEQLAAIQYQRHKYSVHGQIITPADGLEWHFAGVIEAKLKEKNHEQRSYADGA